MGLRRVGEKQQGLHGQIEAKGPGETVGQPAAVKPLELEGYEGMKAGIMELLKQNFKLGRL